MSNYVYLIEAIGTGLFKIGIATDLKSRIKQMQTGCPYELRLVHACTPSNPPLIERQFHSMMQEYRVIGEWFRLPVSEIKQLTVYMSLPLDTDEGERESVIQSLELGLDKQAMAAPTVDAEPSFSRGVRVNNKLQEKLIAAAGTWISTRDLTINTFSQPKDREVVKSILQNMIDSGKLESKTVENPNKTVTVLVRLKNTDSANNNG